MRRLRPRLPIAPRPSVADPRRHLLAAALGFVRAARALPGIRRIALIGSLATDKAVPKDADMLVTIDAGLDLAHLAQAGRRLKGATQAINLGADIFLADAEGRYLGRICGSRECRPRAACQARHCGGRPHLNDDLDDVTLSAALIAAPPLELWPSLVRRTAPPADVETQLLAKLAADAARRDGDAPRPG